jgi:hypothetical protein
MIVVVCNLVHCVVALFYMLIIGLMHVPLYSLPNFVVLIMPLSTWLRACVHSALHLTGGIVALLIANKTHIYIYKFIK